MRDFADVDRIFDGFDAEGREDCQLIMGWLFVICLEV
jgi:hypothetical protein